MPLETTTGRLEGITSKSGAQKDGAMWTRYDFKVEGVKRPISTFNADLVNMGMQGRLVQVSYSVEPASFTNDAGQTINYNRLTLENIIVVEGDTGTLDETLAPQIGEQRVATPEPAGQVVYANGNGGEDPRRTKDEMRRGEALQAAATIAGALAAAGSPVNDDYIVQLAAKFEPYLAGK